MFVFVTDNGHLQDKRIKKGRKENVYGHRTCCHVQSSGFTVSLIFSLC